MLRATCGACPPPWFDFFPPTDRGVDADMALFKFTKAILEGSPIDVYNHGEMDRDFTYVDDIARSIILFNRHRSNQTCSARKWFR